MLFVFVSKKVIIEIFIACFIINNNTICIHINICFLRLKFIIDIFNCGNWYCFKIIFFRIFFFLFSRRFKYFSNFILYFFLRFRNKFLRWHYFNFFIITINLFYFGLFLLRFFCLSFKFFFFFKFRYLFI